MAPNNNKHGERYSRQHSKTKKGNASGKRSARKPERTHQKRHFGCGICQADHRLSNCGRFIKMNLADRYKTAVKLHYCVNCLARNHLINKCTNKTRCHKCSGKHHSMLHGPERLLKGINKASSNSTPATPPIPAPRQSLVGPMATMTTTITTSMTKTFVPTVVVRIIMEKGNKLTRAVLNPSLTRSRIADSFVRDSWLKPFTVEEEIYVKVMIAPNLTSNIQYEICMQVVNDLPRTPYTNGMDESIGARISRISLADPGFYSNSSVAMEIGGDLYTKIIQPNVIHIEGGSLIAQDSTLGWLIMGSLTN